MTKRFLILPVLALAVAGVLAPVAATANPIERACLQSGRSAANPALCACIGSAAQRTLTSRQMRDGVRFFRDPQRAQEVRQSDRRSDEEMWTAWRNFGQTAEAMCS
jgi:hypothetical protein